MIKQLELLKEDMEETEEYILQERAFRTDDTNWPDVEDLEDYVDKLEVDIFRYHKVLKEILKKEVEND